MSNLTFLDEEQLFGNKQLDIFKKRGTKAAITDFSILLGGYVSNDYYIYGGNSLKDRAGYYWTKTDNGANDARVVDDDGDRKYNAVLKRDGGSRPALPFSLIPSLPTNGVSGWVKDSILEVEYGYYPQTVVSKDMQKALEFAYNTGTLGLKKTGNKYTTDSIEYNDYDTKFMARNHIEYEFEGKRYVRVIMNSCFDGRKITLSNGEDYEDGDVVWVEVEPVKWLVDERKKIMVTEKLIFAGVQFNKERNYKGDFSKTDIKKFMDNHLAKDMFRNNDLTINREVEQEFVEDTRKKNPYNFNFDEVSEEDIIKGAVQSNIAVFLHGRSSEGKSARVKQLDPDCEIIYLRNATPESLNGKSVYNSETGEMIDVKPSWLVKLEEKCEKEKDKIHILFFDEITNALPSIQGMAFNIVLDKEVNGKWKLPDNARIVAAGNDLNDSLAANTMAEPLFNRFAHVYINTTVESWLAWASTPKEKYERIDYINNEPEMKIHPSIYAYISYKASRGEDVLRTEYNGEKPNADPRKWEMASKMLYSTKSPEMLRALIGEDLTTDFTEFCRYQVITVEDVIKGNYTERDLEMNIAEKSATAVGLSVVDEENLEVVREFVNKLGAEVLAIFDNLWIKGDEKRLERIAELRTNLTEGGKRR